ncbi:MAG: extracellular matrix regulator RemB [Negativicutes bacterium]
MYLHIGSDVLVSSNDIIAIINYRGKVKEENNCNLLFIEKIEQIGEMIDISNVVTENAKSFILVKDHLAYISPISSLTLYKRSKNLGLSEGLKIK